MSPWRGGNFTVLPCPHSGASLYSLVTEITHKYKFWHRVSIWDRATDTYVNISEALL